MKVLGLIPARAGSKGIPRKNIRLLGDRPTIEWTIDQAQAAALITRLVVSTDSPEIAEVARRCGLDVPFLRPPELAGDRVPTLPVIRHALNALRDLEQSFDAVCLLQPTSPFREPGEIDRCIQVLIDRPVDAAITVARIPDEYHPDWAYLRDADECIQLFSGQSDPVPRRQSLRPAFHRDGSVYVTRSRIIEGQNSLYGRATVGVHIERTHYVNLDTMDDWKRAEAMTRLKGES